MLFDLSSTRRRRTTVRFIYGTLALLIAAGLVVFGIGAGNGNGGIANSLEGNGSSGSGARNAVVTKLVNTANRKIKANPSSPAAWNDLVQARYEEAETSPNYDSTTGAFTAGGKTALKQLLTAYTRYTALLKGATPSEITAEEAGHAYTNTGDYQGATTAWQAFLQAAPGEIKGFECLAYNAYAAKDTTLAGQAASKAEALTPKLDQLTIKTDFKEIAASKATAQEAAVSDC